MAERLSDSERAELLPSLAGWSMVEGRDAIRKRFTFKNFNEAFGWMCRVALAAEKLDHHPDWSNSWNKVVIDLVSHSAGGITGKDLTLAAEINKALGEH